jgi:murein DD-endopeptidase MepM/ murein hydrolase activator NlpD
MKRGFKRLVTFMFIPHDQGSSFSVNLPVVGVYSFILLTVGIVVLSGIAIFKFPFFFQAKKANLELAREVTTIRETMSTIRSLEAKLRILTGASQDTEIATGGSSQETPQALLEESLLEPETRSLSALEKELEGEPVRKVFLPSLSPLEKGWIFSEGSQGLTLATLPESVVRATAEGRVLFASGNQVIIDHGNNLQTVYMNLERLIVNAGERIAKGAAIGYTGEKGISYQVRRFNQEMDPSSYMGEWR